MIRLLRQRNVGLLFAGSVVSAIGDWLMFIALPFYVYDLTGSALATGAMFVAQTLPGVLLSSVAGAYVDRWDRVRTMVVSDALRAVLLLALFLARTPSLIWIVYVVTFVQTAIGLLFNPARNALIPTLVADEDLVPANSALSSGAMIAQLVGPGLGAALTPVIGVFGVVLLDCASFAFSAFTAFLIGKGLSGRTIAESGLIDALGGERVARGLVPRGGGAGEMRDSSHPTPTGDKPPRYTFPGEVVNPADAESPTEAAAGEPATARPVFADLLDGLVLARSDKVIGALLIVLGFFAAGQGIVVVLLVPFVKTVLGGDAALFGLITMAQGLGGLVGGLVVGRLGRERSPARILGFGLFSLGILVVGLGLAQQRAIVFVVVVLTGVAAIAFYIGRQTILHRRVADAYRGRIFGLSSAVQSLFLAIGMGLASLLVGGVGLVPLFDLAALLFLGGAGAVAVRLGTAAFDISARRVV